MHDPSDNESRKIIIDEDWKSQVERERKEQFESPSEEGTETPERPPTLPPASIPLLVSNLATQALLYLGHIPNPVDNKVMIDLDLARHHIDILVMLEEKTKGNLSDEEAQQLESVIHQLQMAYVETQSQVGPR